MNAPQPLPLPFGADCLTGELARFRLWAPDAARVALQFADGRVLAMTATPHGGHEIDAPARPGERYRFLVDGQPVPDPASRAQQGGPDGWSVLTDPDAYAWETGGWLGRPWLETVIYELHVGAFGGFDAVREHLPALAQLGITAIELMPLSAFPGARGWGYDGVLPFAPFEGYGTPDQLKALIDTAHRHGVQVFIDVVYNHFGPAGNYLHGYAQPFFLDNGSGWGNQLNTAHPVVSAFLVANALYWLNEFRCDGLRLDAAHAIGDHAFLRHFAERIRAGVEARRHVHLVLENADNSASLLDTAYTAQWNDDAHHALHVLLTGEATGYYAAYADAPARHLARSLREGFVYQGEPFAPWQGAPRGEPCGHLPPTAFVNCLQNHDQIGNRALGERLTTLCEPASLNAALALLLLTPPIPMLFMGEEWGETAPFLYFIDHQPELADAIRNGRRAEFADFADFADPAQRERIPDPQAPDTFARSCIDPSAPRNAAARERLALVGLLLTLRRDYLIPALPGCQAVLAEPAGERGVLAQWRLRDGRLLTVLANFGPALPIAALPAELPDNGLLYQTPPDATATLAEGHIPAQCCLIWLSDGETLR
ncbi:malto-oligosyltrehalose trehalohydrolase [Chitiniphilus eburneus]|uniref:Malto-oligosyltrehalose trehalohydrolase n=1 Tax=Chitiniphilus eburneus TaxID=2571148 RepID=A0A4U0PME5_9NEIS|nr:malto-oligosyltrehalose trehalohydrolase [Chitiniphilus eburneus]TJZ69351.1 malto-oligosyltrehalose trehalohydrolase [Chitiniphilus eburneus]